jgi:glutamate formiminotransferase
MYSANLFWYAGRVAQRMYRNHFGLDSFLYGKSSRHAQRHTNPNTRKDEIEGLDQNQNLKICEQYWGAHLQESERRGGGGEISA